MTNIIRKFRKEIKVSGQSPNGDMLPWGTPAGPDKGKVSRWKC